MKISDFAVLAAVLTPCATAHADPVLWTDWTNQSTAMVSGTIGVPSGDVAVSAAGAYSFAQTSGGTNYWSPSGPYVSATVDNAPPAADIIGLSTGGTETITFSKAVVDPLIALVSWNGNTVQFSAPIEIVSFGPGYWGNGTPILNAAGDGFFGSGEVHGVVRLRGTYTSFSFTHTSENWHGFTVGITSAVPEPVSSLLMLAGLPILALRLRRRRVE